MESIATKKKRLALAQWELNMRKRCSGRGLGENSGEALSWNARA